MIELYIFIHIIIGMILYILDYPDFKTNRKIFITYLIMGIPLLCIIFILCLVFGKSNKK